MANDYCTLAEVKAMLTDVSMDLSYDDAIEALITRASRLIDGLLKRPPGAFYVSSDETRYFYGSGTTQQWIGELATTPTSVSVAETGTTTYTAWAATDYILYPYNAAYDGIPYLRMDIDEYNGTKSVWYRYPKAVKVVGKFGFATAIPNEIKEATIIQVVRWWKRGQQAFQDAGAIMELGQLRYVKQIDPDIALLLSVAKFQLVTI